LKFILDDQSEAIMYIYNQLGKLEITQKYCNLSAGQNSIHLDLKRFSKGSYFCQLIAGEQFIKGKFIIQ